MVKGYLQTFHLKHDKALNLWRQWRQRRLTGELPALNEASILR